MENPGQCFGHAESRVNRALWPDFTLPLAHGSCHGRPMDHRDTFKHINDAIAEGNPELGRAFQGEYPTWFRYALSDIVIAIGEGTEIDFADASVTVGGDYDRDHEVRIHLFTELFLVTVEGSRAGSSEARTTTVRPRSTLRRLGVAAGAPALGDNWQDGWPGRVHVSLDYGEGSPLELPSSSLATRQQHERLVAFLPSLRADLSALTN